jgi:hypothetical protein
MHADEREWPMPLVFAQRQRRVCAQKIDWLYRSAKTVFISVHRRSSAVHQLRSAISAISAVRFPSSSNTAEVSLIRC